MKPRISIIIPVLREAPLINAAINRITAINDFSETEIIVVDGDANGGTLQKINNQDVRKITGLTGRGAQMNAGAREATGEILLFLHADTILPETTGRLIMDVCQNTDFIGGAFDLAIDSPRPVYRLIEKAASYRSRLTRIPYGDQAIFIKTDYFQRLEGFKEIPLMEDVDLMRRIKHKGYRIRFIADTVKTSARRWEKEGAFYTTIRNWTLAILFCAGVHPEKLKKFYP